MPIDQGKLSQSLEKAAKAFVGKEGVGSYEDEVIISLNKLATPIHIEYRPNDDEFYIWFEYETSFQAGGEDIPPSSKDYESVSDSRSMELAEKALEDELRDELKSVLDSFFIPQYDYDVHFSKFGTVEIEVYPKGKYDKKEDSWPADMSRPTKIVSAGNKMEGDRKHLPEPPRHRSPMPPRTGGPMGKRTDYKPAERQRVKKDIERELDYREAAETALATDIKEIAKKEVLVHTPTGDVQFDVWDDIIDPSADSVEVRNYVDLKTGTTRSSLKYPMSKLQKFLDAGDVEIIGSQRARSLAEQIELLTRALSRFCS